MSLGIKYVEASALFSNNKRIILPFSSQYCISEIPILVVSSLSFKFSVLKVVSLNKPFSQWLIRNDNHCLFRFFGFYMSIEDSE